jgi:glycosyltransferase involved in cell wall biosynthesis
VENTPQGFASAILQLLRDEAWARRLGVNARHCVSSGYDWDSIAIAYRRAIDAALAGPGAQASPESL